MTARTHHSEPCGDVADVRAQFPFLADGRRTSSGVYLDSAATTQKLGVVLERMLEASTEAYASVHRGVFSDAYRMTEAYEASRSAVARFIGARSAEEVVFTRGATEAINLVAATWGRQTLAAGDEIVITELEHHANMVPWQVLAHERDLVLKVVPVDPGGRLPLASITHCLSPRTRLVALTHASNVTGAVPEVRAVAEQAHAVGAVLLVDGCQAIAHRTVDVLDLDADFYVFSGHKVYGPTGIGVLYGRAALLEHMPPYQTGGAMVETVTPRGATFRAPPHRFEAGTPAFIEAMGLAAALDWLQAWDLPALAGHEQRVEAYALDRLRAFPSLRLLAREGEHVPIIAFTHAHAHAHDVGTMLDQHHIGVRTGHHCAQPLHDRLGLPATVRISLGIYNTMDDIDALCVALEDVDRVFKP